MRRLYLYLASRKKDGIKLVTVLQSEMIATSRLTDLDVLKLPDLWQKEIAKIVHDHRMLFEPWVETAGDYNELRTRLMNRGYKNIPNGAIPLLSLSGYAQAPKAEVSSCQVRTSMLRKKD